MHLREGRNPGPRETSGLCPNGQNVSPRCSQFNSCARPISFRPSLQFPKSKSKKKPASIKPNSTVVGKLMFEGNRRRLESNLRR